MQWLATIAIDLGLLFTLLISLQITAGWAELCSIRPGGDKSGLGGFAMLFVLFGVRWFALALALLCLATDDERVVVLMVHAAIGALSAFVFNQGVAAVTRDRVVPDAVGLFGGMIVPTPAFGLAFDHANWDWHGESSTALAVWVGVVAIVHGLCYQARRWSSSPRPA